MFKTESYLPIIESSIHDFYNDLEYEGYLGNSNFEYARAINHHKELFIALLASSNAEDATEKTEEFVHFCVTHDIPYMFVYGELLTIARNLMGILAKEGDLENLKKLNAYFDNLEHEITVAYFHKFLRRLAAKNHLRLSHIANLVEKNLMVHYQQHIEWLIALISYIENSCTTSHPELNHCLCKFGQWLHSTAIPYIVTTSHFKEVTRLHQSLHDAASDVVGQCQQLILKPKHLIHLLQRLDYISLEIGNEIAILNDMMMIEEYSKDPLTGLLTRRLFDKVMMGQIETAKATESQCSLLMCDLDHFKIINDTYGHLAGDAVIKDFSALLQKILRKSDFIFRYGGEEFIVLLPATSKTQARTIAQKICDEAAAQVVLFDTIPLSYTVSIGVTAVVTDDTSYILKETIQSYVAEVDSKLYLAKQNGRNRVE
ncbi:MAG: sensor domain-containing diguanylate cyclase [Pseudomonadota bacterium]